MQLTSTPKPIDVPTLAAKPQDFAGTTQTVSGYFIGDESGGKLGVETSRPRCPCPSDIDPATALTVQGPVKGVDQLYQDMGSHDGHAARFGEVLLTGTVNVSDGVAILSDATVVPNEA